MRRRVREENKAEKGSGSSDLTDLEDQRLDAADKYQN